MTRGIRGSSAGSVPTPSPAPGTPGGLHHPPLLGVQVAAAHSDGEEAGGAGRGAVALQEAPDVEAEVSGAGQVIGVSAHPADDLGAAAGIGGLSTKVGLNPKQGPQSPKGEMSKSQEGAQTQ